MGANHFTENVIAVQNGHENDEKIQALVNALKSDEVTQFIEEIMREP